MRISKVIIFLFASCFLLSLASCKKKPQQQGPTETTFEKGMTAKDTLAVKELVDQFFTYAKDKNFSEAAGMLYRNDNSENNDPELLDNEEMAKVRAMLESIPMVDYEIEYIKFNEHDKNEVLCYVIIAKAQGDMPAIKTKMFFKPVKTMNNWCLCLMNTEYGDHGVIAPDKRDSVEKAYAKKDSTRHQIKDADEKK